MRAGTFLHSGLYYKLLIYVIMNILSTLEPLLQPPIQRALEGQAGKHVLEEKHLSALGLVLEVVDICYNKHTKYFGALTSMPEASNPKSTQGQAALKGRQHSRAGTFLHSGLYYKLLIYVH